MNIMIADDEYIIRTGVAAAVKKIDPELIVSADASDGNEAFSKASALRPDIIIVDINMPGCDGLSFIKKLKEIEGYSPEIIILTGFREFDYVQRALEYGASAFLLKPVKRDTLAETLEKCRKNVLEKQKIKNIVSDYSKEYSTLKNIFLSKLLTGTSFSKAEIAMRFENYGIKPEHYLLIACIQSDKLNHDLIIPEFKTGGLNAHFCKINTNQSCFLVFTEKADVTPIYDAFKKLTEVIYAKTSTILHIGISLFYNDTRYFSTAYYEALETAALASDSSNIELYSSMQTRIVKRREIRDAINIIARDYGKPLSVDSVAEELKISSSHLMHSFKSETGKTFNNYLTEYRIEKAAEMLKSGQYKIYEVADSLGYRSTKHFSRLFKKYIGVTPSEYIGETDTD